MKMFPFYIRINEMRYETSRGGIRGMVAQALDSSAPYTEATHLGLHLFGSRFGGGAEIAAYVGGGATAPYALLSFDREGRFVGHEIVNPAGATVPAGLYEAAERVLGWL